MFRRPTGDQIHFNAQIASLRTVVALLMTGRSKEWCNGYNAEIEAERKVRGHRTIDPTKKEFSVDEAKNIGECGVKNWSVDHPQDYDSCRLTGLENQT